MSKSSLGKGLGDLMNGDQVAGKPRVVSASASTSTITTTSAGDVAFGRGLTTLVSGQRADSEEAKPKARQLLPPWFFFAADVLLLGYVVAIVFDAPRPFDFGTVIFCAVSVTLGCALALIGVVRSRE